MEPVQEEMTETDGLFGRLIGKKPPREILTFEQNLEDLRLCEASQQLMEMENHLFGERTEAEALKHHSEDVEKLAADHCKLKDTVVRILQQNLSLSPGEFRAETLVSAMKVICQEEEQDQMWRDGGDRPSPAWRPCALRKLHDSMLRSLVEERLVPSTSVDQVDQASVQEDIIGMGRQLREDLLVVVDGLKCCYPSQMDICNVYARTYHQALSAKVSEVSKSHLEDKDCTFLLRWVNEYYPEILQTPQLAREIDAEALEKLLPRELLEPLEEQYLSRRQSELMTYIGRILTEEEQRWNNEEEPKKEYGCYASPVAIDMTQFIGGMVSSAGTVVGDLHKAQSMTSQLCGVLQRFKGLQDDIIRQNKPISSSYVKAHLRCVEQLRYVLINNQQLFAADVQKDCLCILTDMKKSAHVYLLSLVHEVLKPQYRELGTRAWLHMDTFGRLLVSIETESQDLKSLSESCYQELIGEIHQEVTEEYVRRLLKAKIKLDKAQQHQACMIIQDNATRLHSLFSKMGSKKDWLKEILNRIAEVLKLQEVPAIQMEVAALGRAFPDLSENHVSALLKLKTNLSKAERKTVQETLKCALSEMAVTPTFPFFSKVKVI